MPTIKIQDQYDKTSHRFTVKNPDRLEPAEIKRICDKMRWESLFVNGRFYKLEDAEYSLSFEKKERAPKSNKKKKP